MTRTHEDRLTRIVGEAMPALLPVRGLDHMKRIEYAIDRTGRVNANAVQLLGALDVQTALDDTQYQSTSTTDYTTCVELFVSLGAGTWTLVVLAESRGIHSGGTSIDYRLSIAGTAYNEITRTAPTSGGAPFFTSATVTGMDGGQDVALTAEFKCDAASTATIVDSRLTVVALRTS